MSINFGTPGSAPATSLGGGFSFGANKPSFGLGSTPAGGFSFGTPASTSAPLFGSTGFGSTATTASTGLGFNPLTTTTSAGFPAANLSFGGTNPGLGSGGGFTINPVSTAASTPATGGFGLSNSAFTPVNPLSTAAPLFGLKSTPTTVSQPSLTGAAPFTGLGGQDSTGNLTSSLPGFSGATAGLGFGSSSNATGTGPGAAEQPRHQKLPNELLQIVDTFKSFVKQQKSLSSDVAKASVEPFHKVSRSLDVLSTSVLTSASNIRTGRAAARRLRESTARALATAEEAGAGGSLSGSGRSPSPPGLLLTLVADHEASMKRFARQVDAADRQMHGGARSLTGQDLTLGMRRLHETLVALAGRLAALGSRVNELKQFYLNLRKHKLHLTDDVFQQNMQQSEKDSPILNILDEGRNYSPINIGNTPFRANSVVISDPRQALGLPAHQKSTIAGPTPFTYLGPPGFGGYPFGYNSSLGENKNPANTASFGSPWSAPQQNALGLSNAGGPLLFSGSTPADNQSGFQLQKPPTGYKRGKH